ncbi:hypothetical protein KFE94_06830 [bacterium SCSIO 12643]|nr:hypothetical protein KFE94_06830 [bacterium SCSIO 12643]
MRLFLIILANIFLFPFTSISQDVITEFSWPMELEGDKGYVTTLYQPQLESFKGNILSGRMALTVKPKDGEMVFGAVWFEATMETDLENRIVRLQSVDITNTHFPDMVDDEKSQKFKDLLTSEVESWDIVMSLDRLSASLEEVEGLNALSEQINNDPPQIFLRKSPAVLVMIDGEPRFKKDEGSGLEYVINTPFFIVKDKKSDYYINGGEFWYTSKEALKGYEETEKVPSGVKKFAEENQKDTEVDSIADTYDKAPEILVETKASELIIVDGEMDYKPIEGTSLLYVSNTESDVIMDITSQKHFVLLAGRWYASKSLEDGDWKFVEPESLPEEFKNIPDSSSMGNVLPSVPGTPQAQSAILEQSIPQTATIDRKEAKIEVTYDGEPKFEPITGTEMQYAVNTDKSVLLIKGKYYAVENAVWFVSDQPTGPWEVSTDRPDDVDQIPPESPVYNVKYVYIYDSTPDVVYVGYTPGYTYSYVYGGVVVYGTGYYYHPWYGAYYYPRPVTYGYGVHYNPYTGWGFTIGISYGWVSWGYHPYRYGYWGPRGYHYGYRHGYHHGYHNGYRRGYHNGYRAGYAAGKRNSNQNVYKNRSNGVKQTGNINRGNANRAINNRARPSGKPNNMYTDKKGNVYQRDQKGNFQNRTNNAAGKRPTKEEFQGKKPQKPAVGSNTGNQQARQQAQQKKQQLNRSAQSRNQGNQNYQRAQQQRQAQSRMQSRPQGRPAGGGARGGRRR